TRLATELLGEWDAKTLPLMRDLADQGYDKVAPAAERSGNLVTTATSDMAQAVSTMADRSLLQLRGLSLSFLEGLLPSVLQTMGQVEEATAGRGVRAVNIFGERTGQ